jgi:uncharacterized protein (DUF1800 family)
MTPTLAAIRFGYGLPVTPDAPGDADGMLALLAGPDVAADLWPGVTLADVAPVWQVAAAARRAARQSEALRRDFRKALRTVQDQTFLAMRVGIARALGSQDMFRERLVRFWADHFTTEAKFRHDAALTDAMVEDVIRPHVAGRFADMLRGVTLHPAMLLYLDQVRSVGPGSRVGLRRAEGLNENLARELMELHTLGVGGGYRQDDVRQAAELLTGLTATPQDGFQFDPDMAEPGPETVLGITYDGDALEPIHALLDDLAVHPDTARHLARKLVVHFVSDTPDEGMVDAMAQAYLAADGQLMALYRAMLGHPAAWGADAQKARQPYDFIVAAFRALGMTPDGALRMNRKRVAGMMIAPLRAMGQDWGKPGGPDGWEEAAEAWINPQGMAARITWAMTVPEALGPLPDAREMVGRVLGERASERLIWAVNAAEDQRDGVGLILASPEFNRR